MNPRDLIKPGPVVLGILFAGAVGLAAGYLIARDPQRLRRIGSRVAEGVERASAVLAEAREELEDLWSAATDEARARLGTTVAGTGAGGAAAAATAAAAAPSEVPPADQPAGGDSSSAS